MLHLFRELLTRERSITTCVVHRTMVCRAKRRSITPNPPSPSNAPPQSGQIFHKLQGKNVEVKRACNDCVLCLCNRRFPFNFRSPNTYTPTHTRPLQAHSRASRCVSRRSQRTKPRPRTLQQEAQPGRMIRRHTRVLLRGLTQRAAGACRTLCMWAAATEALGILGRLRHCRLRSASRLLQPSWAARRRPFKTWLWRAAVLPSRQWRGRPLLLF